MSRSRSCGSSPQRIDYCGVFVDELVGGIIDFIPLSGSLVPSLGCGRGFEGGAGLGIAAVVLDATSSVPRPRAAGCGVNGNVSNTSVLQLPGILAASAAGNAQERA